MSKLSAVSLLLILALLTACGNTAGDEADTTELTEATTYEAPIQAATIVANPQTITAYGQLLNEACVYLNENYSERITGDIRAEYDATCERLHNINLQGIDALVHLSDEELNATFAQLEEIEGILFDSVAEKIGVKAELTEAVTTTANRTDNNEPAGEPLTSSLQEATTAAVPERITAAE